MDAGVGGDPAPREFGGDVSFLGVEDNLLHRRVPFAGRQYSAAGAVVSAAPGRSASVSSGEASQAGRRSGSGASGSSARPKRVSTVALPQHVDSVRLASL